MSRRIAQIALPLVAGITVALSVGLVFGGGAAAQLLVDPGAIVRYGIPIAKGVVTVGSALSLGSLMVAAFALSKESPLFSRALVLSAAGAGGWTVAAGVVALFTFLSIYVEPVSLDNRFGEVLWLFLTQTDVGIAWLLNLGLAALVTVLSIVVRSYAGVFITGLLAVAALWPLAEQGHAAGAANHQIAVGSSFVHAVFVSFWLGGLVMVALSERHRAPAKEFATVLSRYSTIALVSFVVVSVSGIVNAALRVGSFEGLLSPYGILVIAKAVTLLVLGAGGAWYRGRLIRQVEGTANGKAVASRVILGELFILGIAVGLALALARTPTPVPEVLPGELAQATPAEILTGEVLPPPFEWSMVLTVWRVDVMWALIVAFGIFFYLAGYQRLRARGDSWSPYRTVSFVAGMLLLGLATNSGLAWYSTYLFSVHMVGHMLLSMAIPVLLVLSAPVTLASRAIIARKDGSRGAREWILGAVHSRYLAIIGHPIVAAVIFALSLIVFYYSPLFEWALREHLGHQWMVVHFLLSGYLFAQALVGVDPSPHNPPYPLRLILVLATMAFHAFFGLSLIYGTGLLAADWYGAMGREWGLDPLSDQQRGGEWAWGLGEIPTLLLAILVTYTWMKSDDRANKRRDRLVEREGDKELDAYNDMLAKRAQWERSRPSRG